MALRTVELQKERESEDQWSAQALRSWKQQEQLAQQVSLRKKERLKQFQRELQLQHQVNFQERLRALQLAKEQDLRDLRVLEDQHLREAQRREQLRKQLLSGIKRQRVQRAASLLGASLQQEQETASALQLLQRQVTQLEAQDLQRARLTHFMQPAAPLADPPNSRFTRLKRQEQRRTQTLYQEELNSQVLERQQRFKSDYEQSREINQY